MIHKLMVILCVLFISKVHAYNFGIIANKILQEYESAGIRTNFARNLHKEIEKITNDFAKNLTFDELEKHIDSIYLDFMATQIIKSNTNMFIALVWPVTVGHDQLINNIFNKYCHIICYKRILLNEQGARNLLSQIPSKASHPTGADLWFEEPYRDYNPMRVYLLECKKNHTDYEEMKDYLTKIFSNNRSYIENFEKKYGRNGIENLYVTTKCKREIRLAVKIPYAMHINDTYEETKLIGNIVFNENSIKCLKFSDPSKVRLLNNYTTCIPLLKSVLGKNVNDIVVYNSAVLSAFGLRDCADIDFLHDPRVTIFRNMHPLLSNQNMYYFRNYVILEDNEGKHYILEDCPHAFEDVNLDKAEMFKVRISIDDLLFNPFYYFHFHGIKYATIEFMHYFKKKRGRPKDLNDVKFIEDHFSGRYHKG